ncbi:Uncharacterized protein DAT39_013978, partial [Clarias magur]
KLKWKVYKICIADQREAELMIDRDLVASIILLCNQEDKERQLVIILLLQRTSRSHMSSFANESCVNYDGKWV